jgi:hypothetical protein
LLINQEFKGIQKEMTLPFLSGNLPGEADKTTKNINEHSLSPSPHLKGRIPKCKETVLRKRYNFEKYEAFNEPNIVNYIKVNRLEWTGHMIRRNNDRNLKKNNSTPNRME